MVPILSIPGILPPLLLVINLFTNAVTFRAISLSSWSLRLCNSPHLSSAPRAGGVRREAMPGGGLALPVVPPLRRAVPEMKPHAGGRQAATHFGQPESGKIEPSKKRRSPCERSPWNVMPVSYMYVHDRKGLIGFVQYRTFFM